MTSQTRDMKIVKNFFIAIGVFALTAIASGCDTNIARPEDLAALTSVSISDLTVGSDTVVAGSGTTISWTVTDDDGVVQSAEITPDLGQVALSGTHSINPGASTLYTLNVYVDGAVAKSRSVYVTVLDENGDEIVDAPSDTPATETVCDDTLDDDADGTIDCADSDCVSADACATATVYAFSSYSYDPEAPLIGQTVTLTWASTFDDVVVYKDGSPDPRIFDGSDSTYTFTPTASDGASSVTTDFVLQGYADSGERDSVSFSITATSEPESDFAATIKSFSASPSSNLIYGEPYIVNWSVTDAQVVTMDDYASSVGPSDSLTATGNTTHTLSVTDMNDITETRTLNITTNSFGSASSVMGKVSQVVSPSTGVYYFVGTSKIYMTTDNLASTPTPISSSVITGTINTVAVDGDKIYVGTADGLFYRAAADGDFVKLASASGDAEITALALLSNGHVLVGTNTSLYDVDASTYDATDPTAIVPATITVAEFAGGKTSYSGTPVNFIQFVQKNKNSDVIFAITDQGFYISTDGGVTFGMASVSGITGGFWQSSHGYVWTDTKVYEYVASDNHFETISDLSGLTGIHFVVSCGDKYFAAADEGVAVSNDGSYFWTNLRSAVGFLLPSCSSSAAMGTNQITAVTSDGKKSVLEWKNSSMRVGSSILADGLSSGIRFSGGGI